MTGLGDEQGCTASEACHVPSRGARIWAQIWDRPRTEMDQSTGGTHRRALADRPDILRVLLVMLTFPAPWGGCGESYRKTMSDGFLYGIGVDRDGDE